MTHYPAWLCKDPTHGNHGVCREMAAVESIDPMTSIEYKAPRALEFSRKFRVPILYCWCHNCEQWRRWHVKNARWKR